MLCKCFQRIVITGAAIKESTPTEEAPDKPRAERTKEERQPRAGTSTGTL